MRTAEEFLALSKKQLLAELRQGHPITPESLFDKEYKGTSLGLPGFVERLTWKKFKKTFHNDTELGALRGWNVRLEQNALDESCIPQQKDGAPLTFGHYHVVSPAGHRVPKDCDRGLLIHYGLGGNPFFEFTGRVRDPIVAINPGDSNLLLGWSYLDFGVCIGTPSFFTLEYDCALTNVVVPPGRK